MSPDLAVAQYLPLAQKLALRFYAGPNGRRIGDRHDCLQEALVGLLKAAILFDATRGTKFISYAWRTILNHLLDQSRRCAPIRLPHDLRPATQEDAFRAANVSSNPLALSKLIDQHLGPDELTANFSVLDALDSLDDPERMVIRLRFIEDIDRKEVARRLRHCCETVRKIEERGLKMLREMLG